MEGHRVKVMTLHTEKHPFQPQALDATYVDETRVEAIFADTELNLRDAASHLITGESYHLSRFHVPEMEIAIEEALRCEVFDVVLLESLFTTSYIPAIRRLSHAEVILRAHNVEHLLWEEVSANMNAGPKKWMLNHFQSKLQEEEIRIAGAVDGIVAMTPGDASWFQKMLSERFPGRRVKVLHLSFGLDVEHAPHENIQESPNQVLHLGSMDWTPNLQGVTWFMESVWPLVRENAPEALLKLAGRNMPPDWKTQQSEGIVILGEVENASTTYDTPSIVVIPLHAGSGMRIKLTEALAAGRPVVTTSKGMEGLAVQHGEQVLVADSPEEMATTIVHLLENGSEAIQLGMRGRAWARENLDHSAKARALTRCLSDWVNS